jgi:nitroimidazol reductase NimA-like FMN-containing flavoprotein (pyridoxamine 5'-phosphate oxidase superfamily)
MPKSYRLPADLARQNQSSWARVTEMLTRARNYWVCTTRPDGRPHTMPVWGLWLGEVFYFATDRESRKGRNLRVTPWMNVHLESGDDVVILEGRAEELSDPLALDLVAEAYEAKYKWRLDPRAPEQVTYKLRPHTAFTWQEKDFPNTATRWLFEETIEGPADPQGKPL